MNFDPTKQKPCAAQPPRCDRYTSAFRDNYLFRSKNRATGAQAFAIRIPLFAIF